MTKKIAYLWDNFQLSTVIDWANLLKHKECMKPRHFKLNDFRCISSHVHIFAKSKA